MTNPIESHWLQNNKSIDISPLYEGTSSLSELESIKINLVEDLLRDMGLLNWNDLVEIRAGAELFRLRVYSFSENQVIISTPPGRVPHGLNFSLVENNVDYPVKSFKKPADTSRTVQALIQGKPLHYEIYVDHKEGLIRLAFKEEEHEQKHQVLSDWEIVGLEFQIQPPGEAGIIHGTVGFIPRPA